MAVFSSTEQFEAVRQKAEEEYNAIGKIHCPYLKRSVHFNRIGFEHLLFKGWNTPRVNVDQYTRLRFISVAKEVLEVSHTLQ